MDRRQEQVDRDRPLPHRGRAHAAERGPVCGIAVSSEGVDFTRRVLACDWGAELYRKRQGSVESVFGQIKANRGANRFLRRGRAAVRSEWRLLATTHNLLKLHRAQLAAN